MDSILCVDLVAPCNFGSLIHLGSMVITVPYYMYSSITIGAGWQIAVQSEQCIALTSLAIDRDPQDLGILVHLL